MNLFTGIYGSKLAIYMKKNNRRLEISGHSISLAVLSPIYRKLESVTDMHASINGT